MRSDGLLDRRRLLDGWLLGGRLFDGRLPDVRLDVRLDVDEAQPRVISEDEQVVEPGQASADQGRAGRERADQGHADGADNAGEAPARLARGRPAAAWVDPSLGAAVP